MKIHKQNAFMYYIHIYFFYYPISELCQLILELDNFFFSFFQIFVYRVNLNCNLYIFRYEKKNPYLIAKNDDLHVILLTTKLKLHGSLRYFTPRCSALRYFVEVTD